MAPGRDVQLDDGRALLGYDTGGAAADGFTLVWQHGSPQTGAPLEPLLRAATQRGIRLVTYARPSYGGSSPHPGRDVSSAAGDLAQLLDALGIGRVALMGASGGGPHALACAALLGDRVMGVVSMTGLAPFTGEDWFDGMVAPGGLRAALRGATPGRGSPRPRSATSAASPRRTGRRWPGTGCAPRQPPEPHLDRIMAVGHPSVRRCHVRARPDM